MPSPHDIRPGVRRLFRLALRRRGTDADAEMDDEIRLHLALRAEQLERQGLDPAAARAEAERRFGSLEDARPRLHHSARRREDRMRMREWLDAARHDVRLALRGMRRTPGFVVTVVLCLALGIGANAAAFSLFDALLLQPLPVVREPERLVNLGAPGPRTGPDNWNQAGTPDALFSHPMFRDLERARPGLASVAAHRLFYANFSSGGRTEFGLGVLVSGSYFGTLGLRPALGRLLGPADDEAPGAHPLAVLSHAYWTSVLGGDSGVVGKTVVVNGRTLTVVGVAPRGFEGTTLGAEPRVFAPLAMASELDEGFGSHGGFADRRWYWLYVFGRLAPGVSVDRARTALDAFYRPILADVEAPLQEGMSERTMARFRARRIRVEDGRRGQSLLHAQTRAPLTLLFGITGLVALIACANVANLLLARGAARSTEMALRLSLGAGRGRLVAQLLTESLLLAALGGTASLVVARATVAGMRALVPPVDVTAGAPLPIELRPSAFLFAAAVALGTGVVFGLFPALQSTRPDLVTAIRAGGGQPAGARAAARFRTTLVTAQIALSMALLVAAGLFVQSLRNVSRVRLGLDVDRVALFAVAPMFNGYPPEKSRALFAQIERDLAATPGVTSVAASAVSLLSGSTRGGDVRVEGFRTGPDVDDNARMNLIGPGFFRTLGVPLLAGREVADADRLGAPKVAVVNEAFARKFGLGANPVGRHIGFEGVSKDGALDIEIVGLVRDTRYSGVKDAEPPIFYLPYRQDAEIGGLFFYVRTSLPPEALLRTIGDVVSRVDPTLPIVGLKTLPQQVRENVYLDRMIGTLSAAFAALATLLAAVGLYGVLAYTVAQRTREIGVRMALGADGRRVRGMVLLQVARMLLVGGAVGVAGALFLGRAASTMLYGLEGTDATITAAAAALLTLIAFAAGYLPASRASRVDPVVALKAE